MGIPVIGKGTLSKREAGRKVISKLQERYRMKNYIGASNKIR